MFNNTDINESFQSSYYWLIVAAFCSIVWIVYLTYYNSRVVGFFLTLAINRFLKYGYLKIGSFSLSVLSGKIMFREVLWITEDYSVRLKLGYAIFRWWQPLIKKDFNEDLSHSDTRLSLYLENVEFHLYNYSSNFSELEKIFGLDQNIIPPDKLNTSLHDDKSKNDSAVLLNKKRWQWRDLIPVIKLDISNSRIIFGNYLMPQSLMITSREMRMVYTTKPSSTPFDLFMHIVKCRADNFKIMLVPSPKYSGKADEPPRCMGEGFALVRSSNVEIYYYQDEPGLVPYEPESVYLANGDVISVRTWPCWGMDIKCGKNTDFSYGPWCERQRSFLYKFFLPANYVPLKASELPQPGQLRVCRSFDFKMSVQNDVTFDLLFTKQTETQAVHMNFKQGSYLEFTIPWFLDEPQYTFTLTGQLMHVDASTSLMYRNLLECETLEFFIKVKYSTYWNDFQDWVYDLTACRATAHLLYQHKIFFSDLIDDWSSKAHPDIYSFIPYNVKLNLMIKEFEIVVLTNEWNWIDCFGTSTENGNSHIAVTGDMFDLTLQLPFDDYLPETVACKLFIRGESAEGFVYLPENYSSRHMLIAMSDHLKLLSREGLVKNEAASEEPKDKKWHRLCLKENGWVDVVTSPIVAFSMVYTYHPMPLLYTGKELGSFNTEEIDAEESILIPFRLIPLRPLRPQNPSKKKSKHHSQNKTSGGDDEFDASELEPDNISIELEIGPSVLKAYGSLVACALEFKENYLGSYQNFTDLSKNVDFSNINVPYNLGTDDDGVKYSSKTNEDTFRSTSTSVDNFDARMYRSFNLMFHLTLHDVQGHLVKHCTNDGPPCPSVFMERMVVEVDKRYHETMLQVLFSPIIVVCKDNIERLDQHSHLQTGYLTLSALQIRGHAMFSHKGLPIDSETLEYAWLIEVTMGDFVGRLTSSQLQIIVESLQAFVVMVSDKENKLVRPQEFPPCQHMVPQPECTKSSVINLKPCPTVADLKYEFVRLSVDCIDFHMVEAGSALSLQINPIRLAKCNIFNSKTMEGLTILLPKISLKHYVSTLPIDITTEAFNSESNTWLESGGLKLGPIHIDLSKTLLDLRLLNTQQDFLRFHDQRSQRLHFLWNMQTCGCVGGCAFFGNNRNGPKFFNPSPDDYSENINVAVPYVTDFVDKSMSFGFGQSLLRNQEYVF
ncbi:hypothetical protein HELRODRAFT_72794, partial [Helobdella robusta]|uniref:Bridge-like lipid transfer protein family member 1 N-terminal domain-containing protein n=1 Tax=Helobdella robusta TaxID=6412 RepID=T1G157_HELRO